MQYIEKKAIAIKRNFIIHVKSVGFNSFCLILPVCFVAFLLTDGSRSPANAVMKSAIVAYCMCILGLLAYTAVYLANKHKIKKAATNMGAGFEVYTKPSKSLFGKYMNVMVKNDGLEVHDNRGKVVIFLPIAKHCRTEHFIFKQWFGLFEKSIDKYSFEIEPGLMYSIFDEYEQEELARILNNESITK